MSTFHGNPASSIIIIFSPTNISKDEVINILYDELRKAIKIIKHHKLCDLQCHNLYWRFNARIGKDDENFTYHQETYKNGILLIYIINEKQLIITNTCLRKEVE